MGNKTSTPCTIATTSIYEVHKIHLTQITSYVRKKSTDFNPSIKEECFSNFDVVEFHIEGGTPVCLNFNQLQIFGLDISQLHAITLTYQFPEKDEILLSHLYKDLDLEFNLQEQITLFKSQNFIPIGKVKGTFKIKCYLENVWKVNRWYICYLQYQDCLPEHKKVYPETFFYLDGNNLVDQTYSYHIINKELKRRN